MFIFNDLIDDRSLWQSGDADEIRILRADMPALDSFARGSLSGETVPQQARQGKYSAP